MKTITCPNCSKPFSYEPAILHGREVFPPSICFSCTAVHFEQKQAEERQREAKRRLKAWDLICPSIFHDTDPGRIPAELKDLADSWMSEDGTGLGFVGATGRCKTRTAYLILRRYHFEGCGSNR